MCVIMLNILLISVAMLLLRPNFMMETFWSARQKYAYSTSETKLESFTACEIMRKRLWLPECLFKSAHKTVKIS